jgi:hypothetical protein
MELPVGKGLVDRMFLCELALELKMPIGEMCQRMSARELSVTWPAYFRVRNERRQAEQDAREGVVRDKLVLPPGAVG